ELGRDAAIEYGFTDLRFRNPHHFPVLFSLSVDDQAIAGRLLAPEAPGFRVDLEVSEPVMVGPPELMRMTAELPHGETRVVAPGLQGVRTRTSRIVKFADGAERREDL